MKWTVADIAKIVEGTVIGPDDLVITAPEKIEAAQSGNITFFSNPKYEPYVYKTGASAILVNKNFDPVSEIKGSLIKVKDVYESFGKILAMFEVRPINEKIQSNLASISPSSTINKDVSIGDFVVIKKGAEIGEGTILMDQVYIGENVKIGKNTILYPGVKVYTDCIIGDNCIIHGNVIIGSDGFGFSRDEDGHFKKIPQIGNVIVEDEVEIGACTTIDRATMGSTLIKKGVKLDNLIQIGHNVVIGNHTAIAAQTGVSGSTEIGANCMIGGQTGFVGHIKVADNTMIQAQSGVAGNITEPGRKLYGYPAIDYQNYLKAFAYFKRLPEIVNRLREIEREIFK